MTTPEKLFVFVVEGEEISAFKAEAAALAIRHCIATRGTTDPAEVSPVQAYVREDVAEAAVANAPGHETAMAEAVRADVAAREREEVSKARAADLEALHQELLDARALAEKAGSDDYAQGLGDAIDALATRFGKVSHADE